ncbi:hypothetical protein [Paenibacillus sp. FSL R5-0407]|uniref:hypothetical protein n=1 Tax=Paenibacillus sp. FSL R5-0407 TaxID=2975320 RepID=UPI00404070C6
MDQLQEFGLLFDSVAIDKKYSFGVVLVQCIDKVVDHFFFLWTVVKRQKHHFLLGALFKGNYIVGMVDIVKVGRLLLPILFVIVVLIVGSCWIGSILLILTGSESVDVAEVPPEGAAALDSVAEGVGSGVSCFWPHALSSRHTAANSRTFLLINFIISLSCIYSA